MAVQKDCESDSTADGLDRDTHGEMRLMSVEEPQPGQVGLFKVISRRVQPSPLVLQSPECAINFRLCMRLNLDTHQSAGIW